MKKTEINVELLRKELEFVDAHPANHRQAWWVVPEGVELCELKPWASVLVRASEANLCGTAACLAGWTVLHAGHDVVINATNDGRVVDELGSTRPVWLVAARLLGLTRAESGLLFNGSNSVTQLWHLASALTGGAIEVPPARASEGARHEAELLIRLTHRGARGQR